MYAARTKAPPRMLNLNRKPSQPKKRKKVTLMFDEKKRREFLTGFRKRKLQRQQKAREELQQKLKEERKRIKQETKEKFNKYLSTREVPELEQLLSERAYETEGHTVSILEVNVADLEEGNTIIGENNNRTQSESEDEQNEENDASSECDGSDDIVGMSLKKEKKSNKSQKAVVTPEAEIHSKKDLNKIIKKATLTQMKKSKVFKRKQVLDRKKNKKKSKILKKAVEKQKEKPKRRKK